MVRGGDRNTTFTVMFPDAEVVYVSGTDYFSKQVLFRPFAEDHARALFKAKQLDAGTRITLFSCDDRARITFAFSSSGGLVQVAWRAFGDAGAVTPGIVHPPEKIRDKGYHVSPSITSMGRQD